MLIEKLRSNISVITTVRLFIISTSRLEQGLRHYYLVVIEKNTDYYMKIQNMRIVKCKAILTTFINDNRHISLQVARAKKLLTGKL